MASECKTNNNIIWYNNSAIIPDKTQCHIQYVLIINMYICY